MQGWNFADVWEEIARCRPDSAALVHGERTLTWAHLDRRADGVARALLAAGLSEQAKVGLYLHNCSEYIEATFACFKAGLVPFNTNHRYGLGELRYLWDNADAEAMVFHGAFAELAGQLREELPGIRLWLWVDDGSGPCPAWAQPYEDAARGRASAGDTGEAGEAEGRVQGPWGRSGDHLLLLYTGGTTGMPKGVMWRQDDLFRGLLAPSRATAHVADADADLALVREWLPTPAPVGLPACPLMHGTGVFTQFVTLASGGSVVTLEGRKFDPAELLDVVARERVSTLAIVGDAFARPIADELRRRPDRDLDALRVITSSGVMFSESVKAEIAAALPQVVIVDLFSSSEAMGMGRSVSSRERRTATATFQVSERTRVIRDDGTDVVPGSGEVGRVAVGGFQPIGYYKDPEKSAATFLEIDGRRYSVPGDFAQVSSDGTISLLGRGSACINTGGEKVFAEEVEEVLKLHESVEDAVAVGVPDERFGQRIVALVEPAAGRVVDEAAILAHVKEHLAGYKAPRHVIEVSAIGRGANGKVDYPGLRAHALATLGFDD